MHAKSSFFRSRDGRPQRRSNQFAPRSPQNGHSSPAPRNNSSSPSGPEEDLQDGTRLNKFIAASGYCSRRKADELIFAGAVQVNGVVERSPGRRILSDDLIQVEGQQLAALPASFSYIMLHKPIQVMCTAHDPQGRPTVLDCLTAEMRRNRVYPVGRLDYFSEGLLLLTNDGELAQRLMHPRHHQPKTYDVLVRGTVPAAALATMRRGMTLAEGEHLRPVEVESRLQANGHTRLRMVLHQGVNRQIRRMCRDLGLTILRLKRIRLGPLGLGDLPVGECRFLSAAETAALLQAAEIRRS
ncbi:pseudouridine synthase [Desulfovibrio sp.]|uniref:pseudouridine synthase n=1 Tax=Desulfovibrio sp. TaxID=885 RepID=UPI0030787C5B